MSVDFYDLFQLSEIKAIHSALEPSLESIWRIRCRTYSEQFHTPLHVVMNELEPQFILQALYETRYPPSIVDEELEELLETLMKIKDPSYSRMSDEDTESLVDLVMNKELARLSKVKSPTQQMIQQEIKKEQLKPIPKSGSMDFGSLERLETKSEHNKAGFDEN